MKNALIIGGTRNLGPDLVTALLERDWRVTVLNRGQTPGELPAQVERLRADRSDEQQLAGALGERSFDLAVDTTLYNGTDARIISRLLQGRVGRYVFWSTGQVYLVKAVSGERSAGSRAWREEDYDGPLMPEPEPGYDRDQWRYGVEKRDAEDVLRAALERSGFPYVALRMPMINSRRDHYGRLAWYAERLRAGEPVPAPDGRGPLRHVYGDDVIDATLRSADAGVRAGTCLNISQDDTLTLEEMLGIIAGTLRVPLRVDRSAAEGGPWSSTWMSVIDNTRSKEVLGMTYRAPQEYVPMLIKDGAIKTAQ